MLIRNAFFAQKMGGSTFLFLQIDQGKWRENWDVVFCNLQSSIYFWVYHFVILGCFGTIWVGFGSFGNTTNGEAWWQPLVAIFFLLGAIIVGFFFTEIASNMTEPPYLGLIVLGLTGFAIYLHLLHLVCLVGTPNSLLKHRLNEHAMKDEKDSIDAASYKVNRMVENAMEIHQSLEQQLSRSTCFDQGLNAFSEHYRTEKVGGFLWSWRQIHTRSLFQQEGVIYSARMLVANALQYVVVLVFMIVLVYAISVMARNNLDHEKTKDSFLEAMGLALSTKPNGETVKYFASQVALQIGGFIKDLSMANLLSVPCDSGMDSRLDALCSLVSADGSVDTDSLNILEKAGLDSNRITDQLRNAMQESTDETIKGLYPTREYMVMVPFVVAMATASVVSLFGAASYFPAMATATLLLRSGNVDTTLNQCRTLVRLSIRTVLFDFFERTFNLLRHLVSAVWLSCVTSRLASLGKSYFRFICWKCGGVGCIFLSLARVRFACTACAGNFSWGALHCISKCWGLFWNRAMWYSSVFLPKKTRNCKYHFPGLGVGNLGSFSTFCSFLFSSRTAFRRHISWSDYSHPARKYGGTWTISVSAPSVNPFERNFEPRCP